MSKRRAASSFKSGEMELNLVGSATALAGRSARCTRTASNLQPPRITEYNNRQVGAHPTLTKRN